MIIKNDSGWIYWESETVSGWEQALSLMGMRVNCLRVIVHFNKVGTLKDKKKNKTKQNYNKKQTNKTTTNTRRGHRIFISSHDWENEHGVVVQVQNVCHHMTTCLVCEKTLLFIIGETVQVSYKNQLCSKYFYPGNVDRRIYPLTERTEAFL